MRRTARAKATATLIKAVGALALGAAVLVTGSGRADAVITATLFVQQGPGADTGNCQIATVPCATISYALTQAPAGAMIRVADGTYTQQLTISQTVTIVGAGVRTVIAPTSLPATGTDPDNATLQRYLVGVTPGTVGVFLKNVTLSGAAAGSTITTCGDNFVGVYFHDASGGVGASTISGIQLPSLPGCVSGVGVYVATDPGKTSNLSISHTGIKQYQHEGVACIDPGTTCTIDLVGVHGSGNLSPVSQNGIEVHGASANITDSGVSGNTYTGPGVSKQAHGMYLLNAGTLTVKSCRVFGNDINIYAGEVPVLGLVPPVTGGWSILHNGVAAATDGSPNAVRGDGYGDGIVIDSTSNHVLVSGNILKLNAEYGIALRGATSASVSDNTVTLNFDGMYIGGPGSAVPASSGNTLALNKVRQNQNVGIAADTTNLEFGNTFNVDMSFFNTIQVLDYSQGSGTAGTANTWIVTRCRGVAASSPVGIC